MITEDSFSKDHIMSIYSSSHRDPGLIERSIFAFGLLEALCKVGMDFIFKGGSSILLLLEHPMRLSTDIDILVEPGTDIDSYIEMVSGIFPFLSYREVIRKGKNNIIKRHFKFTYESPVSNEPLFILLDVVFDESHYPVTIKKEIQNDILLTNGENLTVRVPSIDCLLGDKLTALAPHTTGIPLRQGKDMEVMKQFYDISTLISRFEDFSTVRKTYFSVSQAEISYRGIPDITPVDALDDTIKTCVCILSRGKLFREDYTNYLQGTRDVVQHVFGERFSFESAWMMAPRIMYLCSCLKTGNVFEPITNPEVYNNMRFEDETLSVLKGIRKSNPVGYAYLIKADSQLTKTRVPGQA